MTTISSIARPGSSKNKVYVVAFGKHPGWDDHIEEIGLETDFLVRIKRVMYSEGMGGNIDSGAWEKLEESKRLPGFGHVFYWRTTEGLLIGRMWSSMDGKGRTRYPMIVAAMVTGVALTWAVDQILPRLETVEARCTGTKESEGVRRALAECKKGLEDAVALTQASTTSIGQESELVRRLVLNPDLNAEGKEQLGLMRILYEIEREMTAFRPSGKARTGLSGALGAQGVRVPRALTGRGEGARAWAALMKREINSSASLLIIEPLEGSYLDVIVGEPQPQNFFCVRANEVAMPPTSRVPYSFDDEFVRVANEKIEAWKAGRETPATGTKAIASPSAVATELASEVKKSWLIPAVGAGLLVVGILVVVLIVIASSKAKEAQAGKSGGDSAEDSSATKAAAQAPPQAPVAADSPKKSTPPTNQSGNEKPAIAASVPKDAPSPGAGGGAAGSNDPRAKWEYAAAEARVLGQIDALDAEAMAEGAGNSPGGALRDSIKKIRDDVSAVKAIALTAANRDAIGTGMAGADQKLEAVSKSVEEAARASGARLKAHLDGMAKKPPVPGAAAEKIWSQRVSGMDAGAGWKAVKAQLAELEVSLREAAASAGAVKEMAPLTAIAGVDVAAINDLAKKKHAEMSEAAATLAAAGKKDEAVARGQAWAAWQADVRTAMDHAAAVSAALVSGAGEKAGSEAEKLRALPIVAELGESMGPLFGRAEEVAKIQAQTDAAKLIGFVKRAGEDTTGLTNAAGLAAVRRLSEVPLTLDQLATLMTATHKPFVADADKEAWAAWHGFMVKQGENPGADLAGGLALAGTVDGARAASEAAKLPDWVRYNMLVYNLKTGVGAAAVLKDDQARAAVAQFMKDAAGLGDQVMAAPGAKGFLGEAKAALEKKVAADLSTFGPGAKGWSYHEGKDGAAEFTPVSRGQNVATLVFLPVKAGSQVSYVCRSETSLGVFFDAVASVNKWDDVQSVMAKSMVGGKDIRVGPRSWMWSTPSASGGPVTMVLTKPRAKDLSNGWLIKTTDLGTNLYYAPDLTAPSAPVMESPVQYVSPQAAVLAAAWIGCRLPTVAEWTAAVSAGGESGKGANRRDATWKKQFTHIAKVSETASDAQFPNGAIFWPTGATRVSQSQDGEAAVGTDDGVLWFAPTGRTTGGFEDLVGNVAEFVMEGVSEPPPSTEVGAVESWLKRGENVRVIGASALSPASVDPMTAYSMVWTQAREGYSDVGFRLAFSVPPGAGGGQSAVDWNAVITGAAYLKAPPGK